MDKQFILKEADDYDETFKIIFPFPQEVYDIQFLANDSTFVGAVTDISLVDSEENFDCKSGAHQIKMNFTYNGYVYSDIISEGIVIKK